MNEAVHEINPIGTELIFEAERVRIWRIDLGLGDVAPLHTHHLDYTTGAPLTPPAAPGPGATW